MIGHIRKETGEPQPLSTHCGNVRRLCEEAGESLGLKALAGLVGLLHDFGKATAAFEQYLWKCWEKPEETPPERIFHAPLGAFFAYHRWNHGTKWERLTAQLVAISLAVRIP